MTEQQEFKLSKTKSLLIDDNKISVKDTVSGEVGTAHYFSIDDIVGEVKLRVRNETRAILKYNGELINVSISGSTIAYRPYIGATVEEWDKERE